MVRCIGQSVVVGDHGVEVVAERQGGGEVVLDQTEEPNVGPGDTGVAVA